jgi:hypothetical protein
LLLGVFVVTGGVACNRARDLLLFITPNAFLFFYISISMALGAWGFSNGYVISARDLADYEDWRYMHLALAITMLCLAIVLLVDYWNHGSYLRFARRQVTKSNWTRVLPAMFLVPFFFVPFDLALLGGEGDLAIAPKTIFAIVAIVYLSRYHPAIRWMCYLLILVLFATFSIHNKREALLLVLPMVYLELLQRRHRLTISTAIGFIAISAFLLGLILAMSISRGYGGFGEFTSIVEGGLHILAYVNSDIFLSGFLNNIEANYLFFHGLNSIELILRNPDLLTFGSTITKPLFVLVPRHLADWKPESMVSLYTMTHDPAFRALGGSWPINVISELFWNFHYLAVLVVIALAALLAKGQTALLKAAASNHFFMLTFCLYAYIQLVIMFRGSGMDQLAVYLGLGALFVVLIVVLTAITVGAARQAPGNTVKGLCDLP